MVLNTNLYRRVQPVYTDPSRDWYTNHVLLTTSTASRSCNKAVGVAEEGEEQEAAASHEQKLSRVVGVVRKEEEEAASCERKSFYCKWKLLVSESAAEQREQRRKEKASAAVRLASTLSTTHFATIRLISFDMDQYVPVQGISVRTDI